MAFFLHPLARHPPGVMLGVRVSYPAHITFATGPRMTYFRYRDDEPSLGSVLAGFVAGTLAGFAAGVIVGQRVGGLSGLASRVRGRLQGLQDELEDEFEGDEEDYGEYDLYDDEDGDTVDAELEERVLEAFRNDPVLANCPIDIGAIGEGIIELSGWVNTDEESEHAVTIAAGTPGVETVVNRLEIGEEEELYEDNAERYENGDPALNTKRWEGQRMGTGPRRQGTSDEPDRHADPKPKLENRWLDERQAVSNAADDIPGVGERLADAPPEVKPDRTGGSPIAPGGVPKGDHVKPPEQEGHAP